MADSLQNQCLTNLQNHRLSDTYASIIDSWIKDEQYHVDQKALSVWKTQAIEDVHRKMVPEHGTILAVLSTPLFLVRGSAHLQFTQNPKYTALH